MSRSGLGLDAVQGFGDLCDRLIDAGIGDAHDRDDADRVLVDVLVEFESIEALVLVGDRNVAGLDVPVVAELLPAHLHRAGQDQVGLLGGQPGRAARLLPAPLERQTAEHARLRRADRGRADGALGIRGVPQCRDHLPAARLDRRRLGILVLVDHVLVGGLGVELVGERVHPGADEGREIQSRVAVQHRFVVDDLVGGLGQRLAGRKHVERKVGRLAGPREERVELVLVADPGEPVGRVVVSFGARSGRHAAHAIGRGRSLCVMLCE